MSPLTDSGKVEPTVDGVELSGAIDEGWRRRAELARPGLPSPCGSLLPDAHLRPPYTVFWTSTRHVWVTFGS